MTDRNNGANTERNPDGTFSEGNPGKPKGARNKATLAVQELLDGSTEALTQKAIDMALEGDTTALRLCLERVCPARKDKPIQFDLPPMTSAHDAAQAASAVLDVVSKGEITPLEGTAVMGLIEGYRKTLEATELEQRIRQLESVSK